MKRVCLLLAALLTLAAASSFAAGSDYSVIDVEDGGRIVGRIGFEGTPPPVAPLPVTTDNETCGTEKPSRALLVGPDGGLENAVVRLKGISRGKAWTEREHVLGQDDCRFEPHILLMNPDADLHISNSDRIAHNVRSYGRGPVFNVGHPKFVERLRIDNFSAQVSNPDVIRVGCDMHPWMSAYILIQKHPYYAVTDGQGRFELANVPPGKYDLVVWHETLGENKTTAKVTAGESTEVAVVLGY